MEIKKHLSISIIVITLAVTVITNAKVVYVQNDDQLKDAVSTVQPGDTIVVRNGSFDTDGSVTIKKNGDKKLFEDVTGFFDEKNNPVKVNK